MNCSIAMAVMSGTHSYLSFIISAKRALRVCHPIVCRLVFRFPPRQVIGRVLRPAQTLRHARDIGLRAREADIVVQTRDDLIIRDEIAEPFVGSKGTSTSTG